MLNHFNITIGTLCIYLKISWKKFKKVKKVKVKKNYSISNL